MAFSSWIVLATVLWSAALPALARGEPVATRVEPRYAVDVPTGWRGEALARRLVVHFRLTSIVLEPADASVDLNAAMRRLLGFYTERSVAVGPPQRLSFPDGEALWVEAPDTLRPYSAAVVRRGTVFTAWTNVQPAREAPAAGLRETFFQALRTIRPVRPEDMRLSNGFSAAAKTFLDLVAVRAARRTLDDPDVPTQSWLDAQEKARSTRTTVGDTLAMERLAELAEDITGQQFELQIKSAMSGGRDRSLAVSPEETQRRATCRAEIERLLKTGIATPTEGCN